MFFDQNRLVFCEYRNNYTHMFNPITEKLGDVCGYKDIGFLDGFQSIRIISS